MTSGADDVAERLKRLRGLLSPQEVADKLGVSVVSVYRWEKRERTPTAEVLAKYARAFNTTVDWIQNGYREPMTRDEPETYGLSRSDTNIVKDVKTLLDGADEDFKKVIRQQISLLMQAKSKKG